VFELEPSPQHRSLASAETPPSGRYGGGHLQGSALSWAGWAADTSPSFDNFSPSNSLTSGLGRKDERLLSPVWGSLGRPRSADFDALRVSPIAQGFGAPPRRRSPRSVSPCTLVRVLACFGSSPWQPRAGFPPVLFSQFAYSPGPANPPSARPVALSSCSSHMRLLRAARIGLASVGVGKVGTGGGLLAHSSAHAPAALRSSWWGLHTFSAWPVRKDDMRPPVCYTLNASTRLGTYEPVMKHDRG